MSYVHCHKCDWEQDDFWSLRYNPARQFWGNLVYYIKPRRILHDKWRAEEMGWKRSDPHSWYLILWSLKKYIKRVFKQKWWTRKSYLKSNKKCPKCRHKLCFLFDCISTNPFTLVVSWKTFRED